MHIQPFANTGDNYTALTNYMLDIIMPELPANAWKVLCFIHRKTFGWNKESDALSYTQIAAGTGIKSSATISEAIKLLEAKQYIIRATGDQWDTVSYRLNVALEIEASDTASEIKATSEIKASVALEIEAVSLQKLNTHEEKKEKKEKESRAPRKSADAPEREHAKEPTPHQAIMDVYQQALGYPIRDGAKEGNAAKWLVKNGYTPEQVAACYKHLAADPWWEKKHISLQTVAGKIGAFLKTKSSAVVPPTVAAARQPQVQVQQPSRRAILAERAKMHGK